MRTRKRGAPLPRTKLKRAGHRSHVGGTRRLLGGGRKSRIQDVLHDDAQEIMRRVTARADRAAGGAA
jgi:hypothetical protein